MSQWLLASWFNAQTGEVHTHVHPNESGEYAVLLEQHRPPREFCVSYKELQDRNTVVFDSERGGQVRLEVATDIQVNAHIERFERAVRLGPLAQEGSAGLRIKVTD
jgi:hypothetical protein